ncbi:MAG: TolC family protein [Bacteroidia bacterium]|nr:TolC family protein [Bacteroidia bacterium]
MSAFISQMELDLSEINLKSNDTLLNIAKMKLGNGSFTTYEYNEVNLQSANAKYTLENAKNSFEQAIQNLYTFLDIERTSQSPRLEIPIFNLPIELDSSRIMFYIHKNNSFKLNEKIKRLEADKTLYQAKISDKLNGDIRLNYGANQYATTLPEAYNKPDSRQSVSVGLQIPVFQWGINKNKLKIADNNYQVSLIEFEKSQKEFHNKIIELINTYNHNVKLWLTAENTYKLSVDQYKLSIQKFSLGKVSLYELFSAQKEQSSGLQKYYNAVRNAWSSYFNIRKETLYDFTNEIELEEYFLKTIYKK